MNLELTSKNYYVYNLPICIYKIYRYTKSVLQRGKCIKWKILLNPDVRHHFAVILDLVITTALVQSWKQIAWCQDKIYDAEKDFNKIYSEITDGHSDKGSTACWDSKGM